MASTSQAEPQTGNLVSGDISALQEQNMVLSLKARAAELKQRIAQAEGFGTSVPQALSVTGQPQISAPIDRRTTLTGVEGPKGRLEARVTSNNRTIRLRAGQPWPETSLTVQSVRIDGVTLSDGTRISPGEHYGN